LLGEGVATALMVTLLIVADWPCPLDEELRPTTQLDAAYAPPPANSAPITAETIMERRDKNLRRRCSFFGFATTLEDTLRTSVSDDLSRSPCVGHLHFAFASLATTGTNHTLRTARATTASVTVNDACAAVL
jgi:hypothetical protein